MAKSYHLGVQPSRSRRAATPLTRADTGLLIRSVKRKKGEAVTLHCERCNWGTELAMAATEVSTVVACAHCGGSLYWHRCEQCGMGYLGSAEPACPSCDDASLDELELLD